MCKLSENTSMRCKSFIFGQLALTANWILFVLALLLAAWVPEKVITSKAICLGYFLLITVCWAFYFITYIGSWIQKKYSDKPILQWLYVGGSTAVIALSILFCVWALPVILITLPLLICGSRSGKTALLGVIAGIGEFAALCCTVLLALLLKALLLGEWEFAGIPFRCDMVMLIGGVLALAGMFARGRMLAGDDWTIRSAMKKPLVIIIWSVTIISVIGTFIADHVQKNILEKVRKEAEITFNGELSADGMKKVLQANRKTDAAFYDKLDDLTRKINKSMRFKRGGKGKKLAKPTAEELKKRQENFVKNAALYAGLNKLVAGEIPAYPAECKDGSLIQVKPFHYRILRSASFALLTQMRYDPENIVKYSELYFKLVNSSDGTASALAMQNRMVKFWCKTVGGLKNSGKISGKDFKSLQTLAKLQAEKSDIAGRLKKLAYVEAIFAYDLYRAHNLTTIAVTGAYFKYDRTEALRSLTAYAKTGNMTVPQRGIAKMLTVPFEAFSQQYEEMKAELNEL